MDRVSSSDRTVNKGKVEIAAFIQFVRSQRQFAGVGKIRAGLGGLQIKAIDTVDPPLQGKAAWIG